MIEFIAKTSRKYWLKYSYHERSGLLVLFAPFIFLVEIFFDAIIWTRLANDRNFGREAAFVAKRMEMRGFWANKPLGPQLFSSLNARQATEAETFIQTQVNVIDTKTSALISHVSIMIAVLTAYIGFYKLHDISDLAWYDDIIVVEVPLYVLVLIGCLDCINILGPKDFARRNINVLSLGNFRNRRSANIAAFIYEMYRRRETYRFCRRSVILLTTLLFFAFTAKLGLWTAALGKVRGIWFYFSSVSA